MDDGLGSPQKVFGHDANPEEIAAFGLRKDVASLCDELHYAIDEGLDSETLHNIVGLWEANRSDLTLESLIAWGAPTACGDCGADVTPYDEEGRLVAGASQWYMVTDSVWHAASSAGDEPQYLCLDCLERRLGRPLRPEDFAEFPINEPSWTHVPRLAALLAERQGGSNEG